MAIALDYLWVDYFSLGLGLLKQLSSLLMMTPLHRGSVDISAPSVYFIATMSLETQTWASSPNPGRSRSG